MAKTLAVGLTGGMGSGKSEALRALRRLGARTLCLDEVAHRVLAKGGAAYGPVLRSFGPAVLGRDGEIDRGALGRAVFAAPRLRRRLERLTHPAILREMRRRIRKSRRHRGLLVVDAPLLFEAGLEKEFDLTAVVTASRARRIRRLRRRDDLPLRELRRRMAAQLPLAEKARRADVVIGNDGTRGELRRKLR
ncbi:MAG: dephospho-CoA kinase, partial [Elusimicrobia bacterium]|nr:dephospho-CoA kinase [Elusimicrobiota bacterium]